jgi:hypothetical protein
MEALTDLQWDEFESAGFVRLGKVFGDDHVPALQERIDRIMLGEADVPYDRMLMQLDSKSGAVEDAGPQTKGHKGSTLNYRKIQDLEQDPLFLAYIQRPLFRRLCARIYGEDAAIAVFRSMFMNKPAGLGTYLSWHQDRWRALDRDPVLTIYTAMDPATRENGCMQIIPGSHKRGIINPESDAGFLTEAQAAEHCAPDEIVYVEMAPGEVVLLHNMVLHASDVNRSGQSRRAFSVCYMDAATKDASGVEFPIVFGENALTP